MPVDNESHLASLNAAQRDAVIHGIGESKGKDDMNPIDETLLERCARIGTSTWSDALDDLEIAGVASGIFRRSGQGRFAAFAVTARETTGALGTYARSAFAVAELIDAVGPGRALMIDMAGAEISTFGGMAALAAVAHRAAAVVIDGGCRDIEDIRSCGLWLASRHVTPTSGKRRVKVESLGQPVRIGGVAVRAGDLVIGDETGLVSVPRDALDRVLARAEQMLAFDHQIEAALKEGRSFAAATEAVGYV
jgi:regulator of RNase E activity RraA